MPLLPTLLRGLLVIAVLVLATWLLGDLIDRHWIDVYVRGQGWRGELLFLGLGILITALGASRQLVAFLAGYGFGFSSGLLLSMLAVSGGCVLTFVTARLLLRDHLQRHASARFREVDDFIGRNTFITTLVLRLLPVGSNVLVNLAAGTSSVAFLPFLLGSALGFVPQMAVFALVGSGSQVQEVWQLSLAIAMFVLATVLGVWLFGRFRQQRTVEPGPSPV